MGGPGRRPDNVKTAAVLARGRWPDRGAATPYTAEVPRLRRRTPYVRTALAVVGLTAAAACTGGSAAKGTQPASSVAPSTSTTVVKQRRAGPLRVGVVLPLTGSATSFGQPLLAGIELAKEQINAAGGVNGEPIQIVAKVDEGKDLETLGQTIIDAELDAIVGPASSANALAVAETVNQAEVVTCTPTAGSVALTRYGSQYLFRTFPSDALQGDALAKALKESGLLFGPGAVAVLYPDDDYGRSIFDHLRSQLDPSVASIKFQSAYATDATDNDLQAIARQAVDANPRVAVVIGLSDAGGRMLTRLRSADVDSSIARVYVSAAMRVPNLYEQPAAGKPIARQAVLGVSPLADPNQAGFVQDFRAVAPDVGIAYATYAYDCLNLIALAAQSARSNDPRAFRDRLVEVSRAGQRCDSFASCAEKLMADPPLNIDYDGASGSVDLDENGDVTSARFELFRFDASGRDVRDDDLRVP